MKRYFSGMDITIFFLIMLLLLSGMSHVKSYDDEQKFNDYLLKQYIEQLKSAEANLAKALENDEAAPGVSVQKALSSFEAASETAGDLGNHSEKYALSNEVEIYQAVPWELSSLIYQAMENGLTEESLNALHQVMRVYISQIELKSIREPNDFKNAYLKIHLLISEEKILEDLENLQLEKLPGA